MYFTTFSLGHISPIRGPRWAPDVIRCDPGWSDVIRGDPMWSGVIRGSSLVHPGWSGLILGRSGLGPRCIKMVNTTGSRPGSTPGWAIRGSSGTQLGSPGLVRGSSMEWWSWTSHGQATVYSPGWAQNNARMSPGIPGRVTDDVQMNTD